jgi:uncharacterized protein (TIGR02271 family)
MDTYSEAPHDLVINDEVITPGAYIEASDGPVGRVARLTGARDGSGSVGSLLVQTPDGQTLDIAAEAVRRVIPNQPAPTVYLRLSRADLGLTTQPTQRTRRRKPLAAEPTAVTEGAPALATEAMDARESSPSEGSDIRVPLAEERLTASAQMRERGRVHIRKRVVYKDQRMVVPLNYEEVIVERIAPERFDAGAPRAEDELIIPIVEERLVVRKETVVKEYLRVRKQSRVKQYEVRGQVRREVVRLDEEPNPAFGDQPAPLARELDASGHETPTP